MRVCVIDDNDTNLMLVEQIVSRIGTDLDIEPKNMSWPLPTSR